MSAITKIAEEWAKYKGYLMEKYPSKAHKWRFTCPHHIAIDKALAAAKEEQKRSPTWLGHCSGCTDPHSEGTHQMGTIEHPDIDNAKEEQAKVDPVECVLTIDEADEACAVGVQRWLQEEHGIDLDENSAERLSFSVTGEIEKAVREKCDNGYLAPAKGSGLTVEGVMEVFDRCSNVPDDYDVWASDLREPFRRALEDLAENGSGNLRTDQWVSVEDRLPPNNTPVLGLRADTWGDKVHVEGFAIDDGGYWYFTQDGDVPAKHPTHWMPLPAPPDNTDKG